MATVQTVNEKIVDLYPFHFGVSEVTISHDILIAIRRLDGVDFSKDDQGTLASIFADVGKWEAFVNATSSVLVELGLVSTRVPNFTEYSPAKYSFEEETGLVSSDLRRYHVHMGKDERHRREGTKNPWLASSEIASQLDNVRKWRVLAQAVKLVKTLVPSQPE